MVYVLFLILWVGTHFAMDNRFQMIQENEIIHVDEIVKSRRRNGDPEYTIYRAQLTSGDTVEVDVHIPGAGLLPGLSATGYSRSGAKVEILGFPSDLYSMVWKKYQQQGALEKS